eukprot:161777_1
MYNNNDDDAASDHDAAPPSYAQTTNTNNNYYNTNNTVQMGTNSYNWQCSRCTLQNPSSNRQCSACGTANPNAPIQQVTVVAAPYGDANAGGNANYGNMDYKEAFKAQLRAQQSWCCSYWTYLHIFMIALIILCAWNGFNQYQLYQIYNDLLLLISTMVFLFGIFTGFFGLYGMYNCIPVAFLLLTVYIVIDIIVDVWIIYTYGLRSWFAIFFLIMWAICAFQFYRLYQFASAFKRAHR